MRAWLAPVLSVILLVGVGCSSPGFRSRSSHDRRSTPSHKTSPKTTPSRAKDTRTSTSTNDATPPPRPATPSGPAPAPHPLPPPPPPPPR